MIKIQIQPAWMFGNEASMQLEPNLLRLLEAINSHKKLSTAAQETGLSYRHAWGILEKWTEIFGMPLVTLERGKGAFLTTIGEKLLLTAQRIQNRLAPQLQTLSAEMESDINQMLPYDKPVIRLHASHDLVLAQLRKMLLKQRGSCLNLQFKGSVDSLISLSRSRCDIAGFHIPTGSLSQRILAHYRPWLKTRLYKLIYLVQRQQGILVAPGNPLNIHSLTDLPSTKIRFINRQNGSGSRLLIDALLEEAGLSGNNINGYDTEEFTHFAVAATIASGNADFGFGIEAAAHQFGLEFIPQLTEIYYLALRQDTLDQPAVQELVHSINSPEFRTMVGTFTGYDATRAGELISIREIFPELSETTG
ncbi:MAG: LysR family transcriptional regulator [Proteobacteria bacterium]|nr:LysR family transcriptional regulator [Pseudomonadota bacterium]MDE3207520.1 helix-turn-helix transcriptional regulator [Pseudomonadota bacterium]